MSWIGFLAGWLCGWLAFAAMEARPAGPPDAAEAWLEKAEHAPRQPRSGQAVQIAAQVRTEVTGVTLEYQLVEPGAYLELKEAAYKRGWVSVAMRPGESLPAARVFQADLPAQLQQHRRLIRYRFTGTNASGRRLQAPKPTNACPNYAYFVYDGIPAWSGAINRKSQDSKLSQPLTFPPEAMSRAQAYHLIGKKKSIENVTWHEPTGDKEYKYTGTLVVDGEVYDHVGFRARGGAWRYALGKNMWKFDLNGHKFRARDDFGRPYPVDWKKVNLRACIQQGDFGRRGEQGLFESAGFRLFNLAGVAAPHTHWIQLRIIDEAAETPANQYRGDFWGLYLAIENEDGRFLKAHGLADGNLYKMAGGTGELEHQGDGAVADRSDLDQFLRATPFKV